MINTYCKANHTETTKEGRKLTISEAVHITSMYKAFLNIGLIQSICSNFFLFVLYKYIFYQPCLAINALKSTSYTYLVYMFQKERVKGGPKSYSKYEECNVSLCYHCWFGDSCSLYNRRYQN